ncbi:YndJ family transporter [Alkalicoccus halolimnae]|uniref:YndJ family transporter n=1 Tax=Alkalicoccus halolimnae TaxID=1667239 RepID=A0A5C7F0M4_9BACI|nr:YndJ family transporter [Alkalicoccus halolimnae]TXF82788.1 hypothetical protein FTX54_14265 [Alkalicoccus halolimnae]
MTAKKNILAGAAVSIIWLFSAEITIVEIAFTLSFLVLIPLLLHIAVPGNPDLQAERWLAWLSQRSLPAGIFGVASVTFDSLVLSVLCAIVWMIFTMAVAACGAVRLYKIGIFPAEETIINIGLLFAGVGGMWLLLSEAGIHRLLPYDEVTMSLTAVHYHYSAVVVPILTGAFGRLLVSVNTFPGKPYQVLAAGTAFGSPLIALGVIQGPPMEVVYVAVYASLLYWLSAWWLFTMPKMTWRVRACIVTSSLSLMISMGVTTLYVIGIALDTTIISAGMMFYWHGGVNAVGFSLFGVLGWYLLGSLPKRAGTDKGAEALSGRAAQSERRERSE